MKGGAAERLINHVRELTGGEIVIILAALVWSWMVVGVIAWEVRARWELQLLRCEMCGRVSRRSVWSLLPFTSLRLDQRFQCEICGGEVLHWIFEDEPSSTTYQPRT